MPDIRRSPSFSPFDGYPSAGVETTSYPTPSDVIPWYTVPGSNPIRVSAGGIGGTEFPPTPSLGFWEGRRIFSQTPEAWGRATGSPGTTAGWRYGMFTVESVLAGSVNGYLVLPHNNVGTDSWIFRRYTNGSFTTLTSVAFPLVTSRYCLMRRVGANIECWRSGVNDPTNWEQVLSVADTTHTDGPWFVAFGTTGTETGWSNVGGGPVGLRSIPGFIRPADRNPTRVR